MESARRWAWARPKSGRKARTKINEGTGFDPICDEGRYVPLLFAKTFCQPVPNMFIKYSKSSVVKMLWLGFTSIASFALPFVAKEACPY